MRRLVSIRRLLVIRPPQIALGATSVGFRAGSGNSLVHAGSGSTSLGYNSIASGSYAIALGGSTPAFQHSARGVGGYSIAIGGGEEATFPGALATGYRSIAIGQRSTTGNGSGFTGFGLGDFGTSVGFNTHTAFAATAVGTDAQAKGDSSTAFGRFANSSALSARGIGSRCGGFKSALSGARKRVTRQRGQHRFGGHQHGEAPHRQCRVCACQQRCGHSWAGKSHSDSCR